jgi:hypothetical protein
MRSLVAYCLLVALGPLCACAGEEVTDYSNDGQVCFEGAGRIRVIVATCESSCAKVLESSCSAEVEGTTVRVKSSARVEQESSDECSGSCMRVEVVCDVDELESGLYTVEHGQARYALELDGPGVCTPVEVGTDVTGGSVEY